MGDLVSLEDVRKDKENRELHELSPHVNIVDDDGKVITTIYHPLSPMAFKQRQDQFKQMINFRLNESICAVTIMDETPTLWQRIKRFLRGLV